MPHPGVACIVVGAGSGSRLGAGVPKAFVALDGRSMLDVALDGVRAAGIDVIVAVVPADRVAAVTAAHPAVTVVAGAETRQASVAAGLAAIDDASIVLVHDAARCLVPPAVFARVVEAVEAGADGAVPVLPVVDTIRRIDGGVLGEVVDRELLRGMQTPQGFRGDALRAAYDAAREARTDDAALVQELGGAVVAVDGDERGFKVTTQADLDRARALLAPQPELRVGTGTDAHRFGDGSPLRLAGLDWPAERRLDGHSDGDAALHAIVDAVLAAAGLGDIGGMVGAADPRHAGADSGGFVRAAVARLAEAGWRVVNVSVQVIAERPRIGPRRAEAEAAVTALVGAPVSISGTTTDGLGFTGRGEGVLAVATALIARV